MHHVLEPLFTLNLKLEPAPMLAEGHSVSPDRRTYTIRLRRGVPFHHGRELTADDVVASLSRWGRLGVRARATFANVESLIASDRYTVVFRLKEPDGLLITNLAWWAQPAVIYPKEIIDEVGLNPVRRFIGTGPYRFVEYLPDRHLRLARFDQYVARSEEPSGMSGRRTAYLDELVYSPLPDAAVRVAAVQRNEFHYADAIPADEYERLRRTPGVVPVRGALPQWLAFVLNKRAGPMVKTEIRHAFLAALDMEVILRATYGHPEFYRLNPGLMPPEHYMWTDSGKEFYNQKNPDRARELLRQAGYRGEPIRWLIVPGAWWSENPATAAKPMLERAGFVVSLESMDWATVVTRRARPELWDVFVTTFSAVPDPTFLLALSPAFPGWYESREMQAFLSLMRRHTDPKVRLDMWRRAQALFWKDAPTINVGSGYLMDIRRPELKGLVGIPTTYYWNTWLER
jgi:peptide/nickel transport system substrate-binding protein